MVSSTSRRQRPARLCAPAPPTGRAPPRTRAGPWPRSPAPGLPRCAGRPRTGPWPRTSPWRCSRPPAGPSCRPSAGRCVSTLIALATSLLRLSLSMRSCRVSICTCRSRMLPSRSRSWPRNRSTRSAQRLTNASTSTVVDIHDPGPWMRRRRRSSGRNRSPRLHHGKCSSHPSWKSPFGWSPLGLAEFFELDLIFGHAGTHQFLDRGLHHCRRSADENIMLCPVTGRRGERCPTSAARALPPDVVGNRR